MSRRLTVLVAALALVAGLTACGNKESTRTTAETEGQYVDLGGLKYQVQISRQLNPRAVEDGQFLQGVASGLGKDDVWFGVFIRVENDTGGLRRAATKFSISDTQDNTFNPLGLNHATNPMAYESRALLKDSTIPGPDEIAGQVGINGQLLLFKIPRTSLDNRPLELTIHDPGDYNKTATVNLDV